MVGRWATPYVRSIGSYIGILGPDVKRLTCGQRNKWENIISEGR